MHSLKKLCDRFSDVLEPARKQLEGACIVRGEVLEVFTGRTGTRITLAERCLKLDPRRLSEIPWIEVWLRRDQSEPEVGHFVRVAGKLSAKVQGGGRFRQVLSDGHIVTRSRHPSSYRRDQNRRLQAITRTCPDSIVWPIKKVAVLCGEGAAWDDFAQPLARIDVECNRRHILLSDPANMAEEVRKASSARFDLIALVRGGGDAVDFLPFDEPVLAKALAESRVPVLLGVGHRKDRVQAARFATKATATPSAAAAFVSSLYWAAQRADAEEQTDREVQALKDANREQQDELRGSRHANREIAAQIQCHESTIENLNRQLSQEVKRRRLLARVAPPLFVAVVALSGAAGWHVRPLLATAAAPSRAAPTAPPPPATSQAKPPRQTVRKRRAAPPGTPPSPSPAKSETLPAAPPASSPASMDSEALHREQEQ